MTSGHFIYIPMILAIGVVIGFILGGRAARDAHLAAQQRELDRKAKREERAASRANKTET